MLFAKIKIVSLFPWPYDVLFSIAVMGLILWLIFRVSAPRRD